MTLMKFCELKADIWQFYNSGEFVVIATNGFIKRNGEAVMGRGIAKQAKDRFPGIAYAVGKAITKNGNVPMVNIEYRIITLPTKVMWTEPGSLPLIEASLKTLVKITNELGLTAVYLPRPGCGNGNLDWLTQVKPLCEQYLDERFHICNQ